MAKCSKCGAQLLEGAKFCNVCGTPAAGAASPTEVSQDTTSMPPVRELPPLQPPPGTTQQPGYGPSPYSQPPAPKKSGKMLIVLVLVAVLAGLYFYGSSHNEQQPQQPGTQQPGTQQPGSQQPGTQQPGTQQPGTQQPGTQQPGTQQPGTQQPGTQEPGTQQPGTQPPVLQPLPQQPTSPQTGGPSVSDRQVMISYMQELEPQIQQLYQEAQSGGGQDVAYEAGLLAQEIQEVGNGIQASDPYGYNLLAMDYQRLSCIFSMAMGQNVQQAIQMEYQLRQQLQQALLAYQQGMH